MSTLTAFPYIGEQSFATPGAINSPLSIISANIAAVNAAGGAVSGVTITPPSGNTITIASDLSVLGTVAAGPARLGVSSNVTNYLFLRDTSNARSNYVIGSQVGGTADGLNIWDDSGQTMIVGFSKQSVRFYQNVVGTAFDIGGSEFNVRAFGALGDGVNDDTNAFLAAISALPSAGGIIRIPSGTYKLTQTLNLSQGSTGKDAITLQGSGLFSTKLITSVTTTPGIVSCDTLSLGNSLRDFALYQSGQQLPAFSSGNYGIRNIGTGTPFFLMHNVRVRYFGDVGVHIEGGQGPFVLQNVEVQSCASWGMHLVPLGASVPEEVQILGGNIHICVGGLRITGAISTGVYDTDIELGTVPLYPAVQLDGAAIGGSLVDLSTSVGTAISNGSAVIYISNALGFLVTGGQCVTSAASIDCIRLDSTAARLNSFIAGYYSSSSGGWYANLVNGANQNAFRIPTLGPFTPGFGKVNDSGTSQNLIEYVGSSAISDAHSLVIGGNLSVATGAALFPAINFAGSEASLGLYRSGASTIAQSYGTFAASLVSTPTVRLDGGGAAIRQSGVYTQLVDADGTVRIHAATNAGDGGKFYYSLGANASASAQHLWRGASGSPVLMTLSHTGVLDGTNTFASWGSAYIKPGTSLSPGLAISSESSLGLYRSATSTMALSYGTLDLTASGAVTSIASLAIKSGANNSCGTAVLGSNGSVNVANTYVKTGDLIFLTDQTPGGTLGDLEVGGIRNSSGFTIQSTSITDTSTVGWLIIRPT